MTATASGPIAPFPIRRFRRIRFRDGLFCPRCGSTRVQGWGRFGWRRRYRCVACRRTFSDFTGTPLAYLKRIELWEAHGRLVLRTTTIRRTARTLGVHPSSAFRWRHRLLAAVLDTEVIRLRGRVSIGSRFVGFSETGSRSLTRPPRRVAFEGWSWYGQVEWLVAAIDDRGQAVARRVGSMRPGAEQVLALLETRLDDDATLLSREGPLGAAGTAAHRLRLPYEEERTTAWIAGGAGRPEQAVPYLNRWKRWLRRFFGVATRYLDHYLLWLRILDRQDCPGRPDGLRHPHPPRHQRVNDQPRDPGHRARLGLQDRSLPPTALGATLLTGFWAPPHAATLR